MELAALGRLENSHRFIMRKSCLQFFSPVFEVNSFLLVSNVDKSFN